MARRRMFSLDVVDSDSFQEMSQTAKYLYFELGMRADDYGFVGNPNTILRMIGVGIDDLKILIAKKFAILFSSGVLIISDWQINNQISPVKRQPTIYQNELAQLQIEVRKRYTLQSDNEIRANTSNNNTIRNIPELNCEEQDIKNDAIKPVDMFQKYQLLESVGISPKSAKGKELMTRCKLADIQYGINYANNNLPRNCNNIAGWIITCLEQQTYSKKVEEFKCSKCKGTGRIANYIETKDEFGYCKMQEMVSDCPKCKGTGK